MSSVPAPRIERLPVPPRAKAATPERTAASSSLSIVVATPDLYPGVFAQLKAAIREARARRALRAPNGSVDLGRATGARV